MYIMVHNTQQQNVLLSSSLLLFRAHHTVVLWYGCAILWLDIVKVAD